MPLDARDATTPVSEGPGITRRTVTSGARLMLVEVTFDAEVVVSEHTHQQDKTGYLNSGRMRLDVGEESRELSPGDAWLTPAGVPHKALTLEPCVIVEAFSPPREEWR